MILRAPVLAEPANHTFFPCLPPPTFIQSKNCFIKHYSTFLIFAFQDHQKCVLKTSGKAKMQTFPPVATMAAPIMNTYVENRILALTFLKKHSGLC